MNEEIFRESVEKRFQAFKVFMEYLKENFDPNQQWSLEEYCQDFASEYEEYFECDYFIDDYYEEDDEDV